MTHVLVVCVNFYILLILYVFISRTVAAKSDKGYCARPKLQKELIRAFHNTCKKKFETSNIEVRAVLARCPNTGCDGIAVARHYKKPISTTNEHVLKEFQGFDEDEPMVQPTIKNCRKKLLLTIKVSGTASQKFKSEYIVIDHVYDPIAKKNSRILTPYVIKLKQVPMTQMYQLKFLHVVNSQAHEQVYNKHDAYYTGCDTTSSKPTCGRITYKGKTIPFSEGFCCSCDAQKNSRRQPDSLHQYSETVVSYSDPAFLLDGIECPRNLKGKDNINQVDDLTTEGIMKTGSVVQKPIQFRKVGSKIKPMQPPHKKPQKSVFTIQPQTKKNFTNPDCSKKASNYYASNRTQHKLNTKSENLKYVLRQRNKRQILPSGAQVRGGQNCADRYTPRGLSAETYHESTHCLRFSDIWYTVYHLQPPILEHSVFFQVFEKHNDMNGRITWKDITRGRMARVGTIKHHYIDERNSLSIKYSAKKQKVDPTSLSLNYKSALLLVPEGIKKSEIKKRLELQGGPEEYLVVHASQVTLDGDQCNVAGVGFEAFFKQPNRCSRPRGTCLSNQPYNLWQHDHEAEKAGKKGCFFLKHYGKLPKDPIRRNIRTSDQYLALEYSDAFTNTINMEIKADFNTILRPQSTAKITEVYVDSTSASKTEITIKITNSGLISSSFSARLTDCPLEMPASFSNIVTEAVLIPPQHNHIFHLEIKCPLPVDRFHCSIEALNCKGELVALRRIRLQKFDRCICAWHCLCACVGSSEGLKCMSMSLQHYHAAGFQGSLPITSCMIHYNLFDNLLSLFIHSVIFLILIVFTLGFTKACIGLCFPAVGNWGLDLLFDLPRPMEKYCEAGLKDRNVQYDSEFWPIHPDSKKRVRSISVATEFCSNIIFFFAYPCNVTLFIIKRICCYKCFPIIHGEREGLFARQQSAANKRKKVLKSCLKKPSGVEINYNIQEEVTVDDKDSTMAVISRQDLVCDFNRETLALCEQREMEVETEITGYGSIINISSSLTRSISTISEVTEEEDDEEVSAEEAEEEEETE